MQYTISSAFLCVFSSQCVAYVMRSGGGQAFPNRPRLSIASAFCKRQKAKRGQAIIMKSSCFRPRPSLASVWQSRPSRFSRSLSRDRDSLSQPVRNADEPLTKDRIESTYFLSETTDARSRFCHGSRIGSLAIWCTEPCKWACESSPNRLSILPRRIAPN